MHISEYNKNHGIIHFKWANCMVCSSMCLVTQSCPTLCDPMDCSPAKLLCPLEILQARILEWVAIPLQGIFLTQGSNPGLPHCGQIVYHLSHRGNPSILEWVVYPVPRRTSWFRNRIGVSCIGGGFITSWATREALIVWYENCVSINCRSKGFQRSAWGWQEGERIWQ